MKKILLLLIVLLIFISISACTAQNKAPKSKSALADTSDKNVETLKTSEKHLKQKDTQSITKQSVEIEHLTSTTFREKVFDYKNNKEWKYEGNKPCIIDFYADWCQPCKKLAPIMKDLSEEYAKEVIFYKVDTQNQKELASVFGIRSIPSILFVPKEGKPQMAKGLLPQKTIKKAINDVLKVKK